MESDRFYLFFLFKMTTTDYSIIIKSCWLSLNSWSGQFVRCGNDDVESGGSYLYCCELRRPFLFFFDLTLQPLKAVLSLTCFPFCWGGDAHTASGRLRLESIHLQVDTRRELSLSYQWGCIVLFLRCISYLRNGASWHVQPHGLFVRVRLVMAMLLKFRLLGRNFSLLLSRFSVLIAVTPMNAPSEN